MSQPALKVLPPPNEAILIDRIYLHDSIPEIAVSKTLSKDTLPAAKMTFTPGDDVVYIEAKHKRFIVPLPNIKAMIVK